MLEKPDEGWCGQSRALEESSASCNESGKVEGSCCRAFEVTERNLDFVSAEF